MKNISRRARKLLPLGAVIAAFAALKVALTGHLLINVTPSIPRGVYWISPGEVPTRGQLVALPIPSRVRDLIYERQYLPRSIELLAKPVAAVGGDHVCIRERRLFINGSDVAAVLGSDRQGRIIPVAPICGALPASHVFVATEHENSFDSRNFGPVGVACLRGTLTPLLTF